MPRLRSGICCPICGSNRSEVRDSRPRAGKIRRRRRCICGVTYGTDEVFAPGSVTLPQTPVKTSPPRKPRAEHLREQRGFDLPADMEDDYRVLIKAGYTAREAGKALGLL